MVLYPFEHEVAVRRTARVDLIQRNPYLTQPLARLLRESRQDVF